MNFLSVVLLLISLNSVFGQEINNIQSTINTLSGRSLERSLSIGEESGFVNTMRAASLMGLSTGKSISSFSIPISPGTQTLNFDNCPINLVVSDSTNINDLTAGWTGGDICFQYARSQNPLKRLEQDEAACACLRERNSLVALMDSPASGVQQGLSITGVANNVEFMNRKLDNFRSGLLLQTSLLTNTKDEARSVSTLYENDSTDVQNVLDKYASLARGLIQQEADRQGRTTDAGKLLISSAGQLNVPKPNHGLLTEGFETDENSCVSVKEFLAHNQAPKEPEFYKALANEEFRPENWDVSLLKSRVNDLLAQGKLGTPEYKSLRARIQFLNKNGLWRAVFSAPSTLDQSQEKKIELFSLLKETMGTKCEGKECQYNFLKNIADYRKKSRAFLSAEPPEIITKLINESELNRAKILFSNEQSNKILHSPELPSSEEAFRNYMQAFNSGLSNCTASENQAIINSCVVSYAAYCRDTRRIRTKIDDKNAPFTLEDFDYEALYDNELDPNKNPAYQQFRSEVCGDRRSDKGVTKNFASFKRDYCKGANQTKPECKSDDDGRRALVGKFISAFPSTLNGPLPADENTLNYNKGLVAFLGEMPEGNLTAAEAGALVKAKAESISDIVSRSRSTFSGDPGGRSFSGGRVAATPPPSVSGRSIASVPATSTSSSRSSAPQAQSAFANIALPSTAEQVNTVISQAATPEARSEIRQSFQRQNDAEMKEISEELSSLKASLGKETTQPVSSQNAGLIRSLNERIADYERQLAEQNRIASELKNQNDEEESGEGRPSNKSKRKIADQSEAASTVASATASAAPVVNANTGGVTGGGVIAAPSSGGASLSPVGSSRVDLQACKLEYSIVSPK